MQLNSIDINTLSVYYRYMPKPCINCHAPIRTNIISGMCRSCAVVCPTCGAKKDHRAVECLSCGMSRKALAQWDNPTQRECIYTAICTVNKRKRVYYSDLKESSFCMIKSDGRRFARYWGEDDKLHYVYRYQWRWRRAHGAIPAGHVIHHKDHDCTNDALSNLQPKLVADHTRDHVHERPHLVVPEWLCMVCGKSFKRHKREGKDDRKYCSKACVGKRSTMWNAIGRASTLPARRCKGVLTGHDARCLKQRCSFKALENGYCGIHKPK